MDKQPEVPFEHGINYHQKNLVDGCFGEGQYESGIFILDQIRSPNIKPYPSYIRQLIFISLFTPSSSANTTIGKEDKGKDIFTSPSKLSNAIKHYKASNQPTPTATNAAIRHLTNYAITNTPQSLLCAIPCYPLNDNEKRVIGGNIADHHSAYNSFEDSENDDSEIARQSSTLKQFRDCWDMLKDGAVKWQVDTKVKRKQSLNTRQRRHNIVNTNIINDEGSEEKSPNIIGKSTWPILEWILRVFEKEELSYEIPTGRCSPSLLCHIKPNSIGTGPRSDIDVPLDIVFASYAEADIQKTQLGSSLMRMLMHLAQCMLLSTVHLIAGTNMRLLSANANVVSAFLSDLTPQGVSLIFKVVLCDKYLSDFMKSNDNSKSNSKPQARRAKPSQTPTAKPSMEISSSSVKPPISISASVPWALPMTSRIIQVLASQPLRMEHSFTHDLVKYHLIIAYGTYKAQEFVDHKTIDSDWTQFISESIEAGRKFPFFTTFSQDEPTKRKLASMREILLAAFQSWQHLMRS